MKMKKQTLWLIIVVIAIITLIWYFEAQRAGPVNTISSNDNADDFSSRSYDDMALGAVNETLLAEAQQRIAEKEKKYPHVPELTGISGYLNTPEGTKISDFRGKVVLVDFWTYTCINCIRTLPHLVDWNTKYADKGLVIVGVHTPEFEFEKEKDNVAMAIEKYGIEYPVVQDNDYKTWNAFKNRYWPRKYLVDADGFIRYDHIGEGGYDETEQMIRELLTEAGYNLDETNVSQITDETPREVFITRELYAGYQFALGRGQDIGNDGGMQPDKEVDYTLPADMEANVIYLKGKWKANAENLEALEDGATFVLKFYAKSVNVVAKPLSGNDLVAQVLVDGKNTQGNDLTIENGKSVAHITEPRLYNVYSADDYEDHTLTVHVDKGFSFNAMTFG